MKVLGSVRSLDEAAELARLGIDVLDVKNPAEGSLGAPQPRVLAAVAELGRRCGIPVSVALGDFSFQPGTAALAACGAAQFDVQYVKVGLRDLRDLDQAVELLKSVRAALLGTGRSVALVAAGFADGRAVGGIAPLDAAAAAHKSGCAAVMLDTLDKHSGDLFSVLPPDQVARFIRTARDAGLAVALAGSLRREHLPLLAELGPDLIGVRGALCRCTRNSGIDREVAAQFLAAARHAALSMSPHASIRPLGLVLPNISS